MHLTLHTGPWVKMPIAISGKLHLNRVSRDQHVLDLKDSRLHRNMLGIKENMPKIIEHVLFAFQLNFMHIEAWGVRVN